MKSAKNKAAEVCRKLGLPVDETENGVAYQIILFALQEHEQDMRHACAETIVQHCKDERLGNLIAVAEAYNVCMNAKVE